MIALLRAIPLWAYILAGALALLTVQTVRLSGEKADHAETKTKNATVLLNLADVAAKASEAVRKREVQIRGLLDSSNEAREQGIANAVKEQQRIVDGVRDESIRLRREWRGCPSANPMSSNAESAPSTDDGADLRATGAGSLVRVGDDADVHVLALQDYARACQALTGQSP